MKKNKLLILGLIFCVLMGCKNDSGISSPSVDREKPSVMLLTPVTGTAIKLDTAISIIVNALDNSGIAKVTLFIDKHEYSTVQKEPYAFSYNTANNLGTHEAYAVAVDVNGNSNQSESVTFKVVLAGTEGTSPNAPTLISPPKDSTGIWISPQLIWNSSRGATSYNVQLSSQYTFESIAFAKNAITDTSVIVTNLNLDSNYYWRVQATNMSGGSPWSAPSHFCVGDVPNTPQLAAPQNNGTNIPLTTIFEWHPCASAEKYHFQLSESQDLNHWVYDLNNLTDTNQVVELLSSQVNYYWRVLAYNKFGNSRWSQTYQFSTGNVPVSPNLVFPTNSSLNQPLHLALNWDIVAGVDAYDVQVSPTNTFQSLILDKTISSANTCDLNGLNMDQVYYWHVRSINKIGKSGWGATWQFKTGTHPDSPVLQQPANLSQSQQPSLNLVWGEIANATGYSVEVSLKSDFSGDFIYKNSVLNPAQNLTGLKAGTTYFWHVNAINSFGGSNWSPTWSFVTGNIPVPPGLVQPVNNAMAVLLPPSLSWNSVPTANAYSLQVASDSTFSTLVYTQSGLTTTLQSVPGLSYGKIYFWRVNATNAFGNSPYCPPNYFTTIGGPLPSVPSLVSPANNGVNLGINQTLAWSQVSGASSYHLQIALSADFGNPIVNQVDINTTSYALKGLMHSTTYFWRVSSINQYGETDWSAIWQFTIFTNTIEMINVPEGSFNMGDIFNSGSEESLPVHTVNLSGFKISKTEVSQAQWTNVLYHEHNIFSGPDLPMDAATWYQAILFCNKLSVLEGKTPCYSINGNVFPEIWNEGTIVCNFESDGYRLPTEAEWEYAARSGGKDVQYSTDLVDTNFGNFMWYYLNSSELTHKVATKKPNALGIYDMCGNVWEWCWDWYDANYYKVSPTNNPTGPASGVCKIRRGGSMWTIAQQNTTAYRDGDTPDSLDGYIGIRIVQRNK